MLLKTRTSNSNALEFILSDATPDRHGDVIDPGGWDLSNFARNPICLFNHNANMPIGTWAGLRVEKGALRGYLTLAPEGTSSRIDEVRKLVAASVLRSVSVGFKPIASEPRGQGLPGIRFTKQELIETSLVSIPSNPAALAVARSLEISDDTIGFVFAKHVDKTQARPIIKVPERPSAAAAAKLAKLEAEHEQLVRRLCTAVDHLANARALYAALKEMPASAARSQELAVVLQQMRGHEITASALSTLLGVNGRELQRLDQQIAITRTARAHIARRK